jgi:hypothetical protein
VVRPGGKVVVVGYIDGEFTARYQDVMLNEKEIIGIRASNRQDLFGVHRFWWKRGLSILICFPYCPFPGSTRRSIDSKTEKAWGDRSGTLIFEKFIGGRKRSSLSAFYIVIISNNL